MIPPHVFEWLPDSFSLLTLILILSAFSDKGDARHAWLVIVFSHLFMTLSIALLNENFGHNHMMIYLSGTLISAVTGYVCLHRMHALDRDIQLNQFHGYVYEHPKTAIVFLIACLGFLGLPFTPSFIGIDLLFSHIHKHEEIIIVLTALSFLVVEIAILRIYTRVFLGQYKKANHAMAYRSS
jgi:NADH:ubiquinone oxidoreductase subunit 4 (subunit M)